MANNADSDIGHCLCGAITFKVEGEPIYNVICHCINCKRAGGSTLHTACIYRRKQYTLLTPRSDNPSDPSLPGITVYADKDTQSGYPLYRRFCNTCGSPISALTPLAEEIISIPAGVFPGAGKNWKPHKEQFVQDKVDWVPNFLGVTQSLQGPSSDDVKAL